MVLGIINYFLKHGFSKTRHSNTRISITCPNTRSYNTCFIFAEDEYCKDYLPKRNAFVCVQTQNEKKNRFYDSTVLIKF